MTASDLDLRSDPDAIRRAASELRAQVRTNLTACLDWHAAHNADRKADQRLPLPPEFAKIRDALKAKHNDLNHLLRLKGHAYRVYPLDANGSHLARERMSYPKFRAVIGYPGGCAYDLDIVADGLAEAAWFASRHVGHFDRAGERVLAVYALGEWIEALPPLEPPDLAEGAPDDLSEFYAESP